MRGRTLTIEQELITEQCCNCFITFAMTIGRARQLFTEAWLGLLHIAAAIPCC